MKLAKWLAAHFAPQPVEHAYRPAEVEAIGFNAVADALQVSPTLEGGWSPGVAYSVVETIQIENGPMRAVEPPPSLLDRHAAIATEAIDKFAADEQRLLEAIRTAEADHATHIAGLRQQLADTRTALRFYKTGPDMLKSRPARAERPAKAKTRPTRRAQTKTRKARDAAAKSPAPLTLKEAQSVGRSLRKVKAVPAVFDISKPPTPAEPSN